MIKQVTDLGRNWARLSLDKGRVALETSADRLRATAELFGSWSTKLSAPGQQDAAAPTMTGGVDADAARAETAEATAN